MPTKAPSWKRFVAELTDSSNATVANKKGYASCFVMFNSPTIKPKSARSHEILGVCNWGTNPAISAKTMPIRKAQCPILLLRGIIDEQNSKIKRFCIDSMDFHHE